MARKKYPEAVETGGRIRLARVARGLSMEQLGALLSPPASKGAVSNWENGYNLPNNSRLKQLSDVLKVSTTYLLSGKFMLRDIHMMPEIDQENIRISQKRMTEDIRENFIKSTQSNLSDIDLNLLPSGELYLLNHFTRFLKNYRNVDSGRFINEMFATFAQLNSLFEDYSDSSLSVEKKLEAIDFYTNDLKNETNRFYTELSDFLKDNLN